MNSFIQAAGEFLLHGFFPPFCSHCQKLGSFLCAQCYERITFQTLPLNLKLEQIFLDQVLAVAAYEPPISDLIMSLKYKKIRDIGSFCGELLYYTVNFPDADCVTCVPLHPQRQSQRGFNQAELIAWKFAELSGIPYKPLLQRKKHVQNQAAITDRQKRMENLLGVFECNTTPLPKQILLIDDVTTTGTTLNECARVLQASGAGKITALVIAHGW